MGERENCPDCDDSGWVETVSGGLWEGNGRSRLTICDCICGDDVRRERATRPPQQASESDGNG